MIAVKRLWKNDYFKTVVAMVLIVVIVLSAFFGLKVALNVTYGPVVVVESGSMCVPYGYDGCVGWKSLDHPFAPTLHTGDVIIIQGVNPKDLKTNYPNSDIIVFYESESARKDPHSVPVIHRIIGVTNVNGVLYFQTKGDGNGTPWPAPTHIGDGTDPWDGYNPPGIPQDLVVGKVVMRIPWFGWLSLVMQKSNWGIPVIVALIILLVVIEFVIPIIREQSKKSAQQNKIQPQPQMYL